MARLALIPTPAVRRWHDVRIQFVPVLVFGLALVTAAGLWRQLTFATALVGQVQSVQAELRSPDSAFIKELSVTLFQEVRANEPIAVLDFGLDPGVSSPRAALLRGRSERLMAELGHPDRDLERTELDYERLKVDLENQEILLATARVNLQRAEDEFQRTKQLFEAQVVSERVYQLAARTKEGFEVEVRQREGLVKDLSARLETRKAQIDWERQLTELQRERVASNQLEIALLSTNMVLSAPIDGSITAIYRRAGEVVQPGDPIVSISSAKAEQILCYLRQPLPLEPRRGMQVRVRTRSLPRQEGWAEIVSVGSQMELVAAALRHPGMTTEIGLPVAVSLPLGVSLRPGELVDLSILPNGRRTSTALASRTR